ncbi:MAG: DegT/DnrJ/EryC1/StrS family aminotransferase [Planctomycetota bacterium]|jgi:dTDP-4-amino-4,6-dideoxygalactose transaminase
MEIREIPFLALGGVLDQEDVDAAMKVIEAATEEKGDFFPLPEENDFQDALSQHEGSAKAIAVNSCGTALDCCMKALGISEGDEVITTPLTFVCSAGTAIGQGAKVVFADIDPVTMNLDPAKVREKITDKTKAIIPVHFTGLACDLDEFDKITADTGVPVIYDAAHAVGTKYKGKPIGGRGKASCYSFQSNKNMTCLGEGGAVTSDDADFAEKVRQLKTFGYVYGAQLKVASIGFNYRMTKPQYAVGITQLKKIDKIIKIRQDRMSQLNNLLADVEELILPQGHGPDHGSHLHVLRINTDKVSYGVEDLRTHLKEKYKVATAKHYPAVWEWDALKDLGYTSEGCPEAEKACKQVFTTPIFASSTESDVEYIAWAIKETVKDLNS